MLSKLIQHWFLVALGVCFTVGYVGADQLQPVTELPYLRSGIVFVVMWMMGVTLQAGTIRRSFTRPLPALLAIAINIAIVPLLCLPTMWLLSGKLFGGLFVASIVPCTLASASVWTRKANGDDSIAMMTTVVTNLACVVVVPVGILLVLSQSTSIDVADQVQKLSLIVVLPMLIAQAMRGLGWDAWADRNKLRIAFFSQLGILSMVVFGAVASAKVLHVAAGSAPPPTTSGLLNREGVQLAILILAAAAIHTAALGFGIVAARLIRLDRARQIAIGIAGSQKTLMIGLQIAIDCGVSVIPMLIYHLSQLVIDTLIADRWKRGEAGNASNPNVARLSEAFAENTNNPNVARLSEAFAKNANNPED
jgi:sodium/bile acid cotransporter 7